MVSAQYCVSCRKIQTGSKTRTERRGAPVFSCLVEVLAHDQWRIHTQVAASVDARWQAGSPPLSSGPTGMASWLCVLRQLMWTSLGTTGRLQNQTCLGLRAWAEWPVTCLLRKRLDKGSVYQVLGLHSISICNSLCVLYSEEKAASLHYIQQ